MQHNQSDFGRGLRAGIPIALSYFSVSFGFGIAAVAHGISALLATLMSVTNLTSAGQMAALGIISAGGTLGEMALTQLAINLRYFLMSLSLSQKMGTEFTLPRRFLCAMGVTDEIFGVAYSDKEKLTHAYFYGLALLPILCWTAGTLLGAIAGNILPDMIKNALGICIYGMFISIFLTPMKKDRGIAVAVGVAVAVSCLLAFVPLFSFVSTGFSIVVCAILGAVAAAALFPVEESEETV